MSEQQRLTAEELREIAKRCENATDGPWESENPISHSKLIAVKEQGAFDWICSMQVSNCPNFREDAVFIAASRTDIPRLLAHISALDKRIEQLSELTAHDIECAVTKRMERLEQENPFDVRLKELSALQGFILCGDDYE